MTKEIHPLHTEILRQLILRKHQKDASKMFSAEEIKIMQQKTNSQKGVFNTYARVLQEKRLNGKLTARIDTLNQIIQYVCGDQTDYFRFIEKFSIIDELREYHSVPYYTLPTEIQENLRTKAINHIKNCEPINQLSETKTLIYKHIPGTYYSYFRYKGKELLGRAKSKFEIIDGQLTFTYQVFDFTRESLPVEILEDCIYLRVKHNAHPHILTTFAFKAPLSDFDYFICGFLSMGNCKKMPQIGTEIFVKQSNNPDNYKDLQSIILNEEMYNEQEPLILSFLMLDNLIIYQEERTLFEEMKNVVEQLLNK